ncbi:uncharacterized protein [Clytia hemisphaerica]|uniref:CUB domain-containing protein n=1 Tax=Clytia hemisphaerica TaxID=252671 RepID=A0A7M5VG77_9CNID
MMGFFKYTTLLVLILLVGVLGQEKGSIVSKKCEYVFRANNQYFTSPGYPEFYPNKAVCRWKIIADEGFHIKLTIINVDIEDSKHCKFDSVTVYDGEGDTAIPIRRLCGTKLPENIQSISNVFTITMETDGYGNGKGFQMKYSIMPECLLVSEGSTGVMESPGYPLGYPDGVSCNFHFPLVEVGKFIHIYFEDFQLEEVQHYECFDHLSLLTLDESGEEKMEGQFCGTALKEKSLCFKTGQLSMKFVTDKMWNTRGFKVSYMISEDECSAKDDISHLIDDTQQTVQLTDLQVLQQLLERELNEASYISSIVNKDEPINAEKSKLTNQHEVSSVKQPIGLQHLSPVPSIELQLQSSQTLVSRQVYLNSSNLHETVKTHAINTNHLLLNQYSKSKSIKEASQVETKSYKSNQIYKTKISKEHETSQYQFTQTPTLELKAISTIGSSYNIQPSKSLYEKQFSTSPSRSIEVLQTSSISSKLEPSSTSYESIKESQTFEQSTFIGSKYSEANQISSSSENDLSSMFIGQTTTNKDEIAESSRHLKASSEILSTKLSMTSQSSIPPTKLRSESNFVTDKITPSISSTSYVYATEIGKSLATKVSSSMTVDSDTISQSKESGNTKTLLANSDSEKVVSTETPAEKYQFSSKITGSQSISITDNEGAQQQTGTPMATETTETLCFAPISSLPASVLLKASHTASVLEAHESKALKMENIRMRCGRYLNFEWRGGRLPLDNLSLKAKEVIGNAFGSKILNTFEVCWPQDGLAGEQEIMNYGNLLTTAKGTKFLLRIQQNHIHLVEITADIVEAYEMKQLMELPTDSNKKESLKEYLRRIPSTVKVSLLFC